MPLLSIADGALFAERFGSGAPRVLALHGWGRRGSDFTPALGGLDALALDLPGFGASAPPVESMGAAGYAALVEPALELFDEPPVVVGHSFGGRVAVALQDRRADAASGMVLVGVPLLHRQGRRVRPPVAYRLARTAHRLGILGEEGMERRRRRHGSADYRSATGVMRDVLVTVVNEAYAEQLARLRVPVHLLWGSEDVEVPLAVAEEARLLLSSVGAPADLEVLEGVGHHVPLRAPDALSSAVERMLARVEG